MVNDIASLFGGTPTYSTTDNSVLGKDDFLNLMIEQLKNQNPLEPMEGTEFTAQLAEFSSLEQLTNMSNALYDNIAVNLQLTQAVNNTMTAALIGKGAKLSGSGLTFNGQESIDFGYNLAGQAHTVTVKLYDQNGNVVRTFEDTPGEVGDHKLSWDFTDDNGDKVSEGDYYFEVKAKATNDSDLHADVYRLGTIDAVRFSENGTVLVINNVEYFLSEVYEILNSSNNSGEPHSG